MTAHDLFRYFGNRMATARALGVDLSTARYWEENGLPLPRQWQAELATNRRLKADQPALVDPNYDHDGPRLFPKLR
jgi:hypothetical protein